MKEIKLIIIIILIILIVIYLNRLSYENMGNTLSNEAIQDLASVYNSANLQVTNLTTTGSISFLPKGTIVIWSGSSASCPNGWQICNGTNGTPNLQNTFVLGAGSAYAVGATGGEVNHTLTTNEMPVHNHQTIDNSFNSSMGNNYFGNGSKNLSGGGGWSFGVGGSAYMTSNTGGGQAHNNMPPYYALCYIMRMI